MVLRTGRKSHRNVVPTTVLALVVLSALPAAASAGEFFTVDGKPAHEATAQSAAAGCAALAAPSGEVACFSSETRHRAATIEAVKANRLPPGWDSMPSAGQREQFLRGQGASAAGGRGPRARAADSCGVDDTHVYTGANMSGSQTWYGLILGWPNFSSTFNNTVSSYWASRFWVPTWHDGVSGSGAYYDLAHKCREAFDLANGDWNNRFSSYHNE